MKRALAIAAFLATASVGLFAFAGDRTSAPVTIDTTARRAAGSLGSTRNASPSGSYIGCQIIGASGSSTPSFVCSARVGGTTPVAKTCSGSGAAMVAAAAAVTTDSHIVFKWDSAGTCTNLTVSNFSDYEPKAP
jgi:hypothetical protein